MENGEWEMENGKRRRDRFVPFPFSILHFPFSISHSPFSCNLFRTGVV
jgi:hypothetical protein